jgi:ribonuclease BN (tRNA processing enzyme)
MWSEHTRLHVWGPSSPLRSLEDRIARYLSPPLFPLHLSDVPAAMTFHDTPDEPWELCGARVTALPVSHPGPTLGYRIEVDGRSLAYIPDHEPVLGIELEALSSEWISGYELAESVDVLLHDSQWTEDEYPSRVGWGHSSVAHAVMFALGSSAGRLVLFHHDPARADTALEGILDRALELWQDGDEPPALAYEGMEVAV